MGAPRLFCYRRRMTDLRMTGRLEGLDVAVAYALTAETVGEAVRRHDCDPAGTHVLGRALTAGVLAAAALGEGQRLNLRWAYEGLLRTLVVDTGPDGATRAFISPPHLLESADEGALYGNTGSVQVVRSRKGAVVAHGTTRADLLDVVEDLNHFLCTSDQVESAMAVTIALSRDPALPVHLCRGILLQALPGCDLVRFQRLRDRLYAPAVRALMARREETDNHVENLLRAVIEGEEGSARVRLEPAAPPRFQCSCSREKMGAVLRALPYGDRMDMVRKNEPVVVNCRFCGQRYALSIAECIVAWNEKSAPPP